MTPRRSARDSGDSADLDLFPTPQPESVKRAPRPASEQPVAAPPLPAPGRYPGETAQSAITIGTLTETARELLEGAFIPLWIRGEVGDFKAHRNGHWYFTLRDRTAQVRAVVWNRDQRRIAAPPDDGMQVVAFGRPTVYPARGELQFTVVRLDAEGDGLRRKALEKTRQRLEADGLLAPERKRALPRFPRVIAVITSPDGAALHDIVAVVRRRRAVVRLVVVPAAVQGDSARAELCAALRRVSKWGRADVVIVSRGGGAKEDLSVFNDEKVARAVAACPVPTISAVGHEIDVCMCDLVADMRAPTPSAAAEAATRSREELEAELRRVGARLTGGTRAAVRARKDRLRHAARDLAEVGSNVVAGEKNAIQSIAGRLHALSPLATLARGYAVPRDPEGATLTSAKSFIEGMPFELVVRDGLVPALVRGAPDTKQR
jgi:exodeoxyribonuclease VII large subunit